MKTIAPILLLVVALHYLCVISLSSKIGGIKAAGLTACVLIGTALVAWCNDWRRE